MIRHHYIFKPLMLTLIVSIICLVGCIPSGTATASHKYDFDIEKALKADNVIPMVILGSGPAGLSAALYAARGKIKTLVLEGGLPGGLLPKRVWLKIGRGLSHF